MSNLVAGAAAVANPALGVINGVRWCARVDTEEVKEEVEPEPPAAERRRRAARITTGGGGEEMK